MHIYNNLINEINMMLRMSMAMMTGAWEFKKNPTKFVQSENGEDEWIQYRKKIDKGEIEEVENEMWACIERAEAMGMDSEKIKIRLLMFYAYVNTKSDEFLIKHHFSREEIVLGIENVMGQDGIIGLYGKEEKVN